MNNSVFGKTMENVRKHRHIKHVTTERRKKLFVGRTKLSYYKVFDRKCVDYKNEKKKKKTQIFMNEPVYWGLSVLDLSKSVMYKFWYDFVKPKYGEKARLWNIDTDSFIVYTRTDHIYKDTAEDVDTRSDRQYLTDKIDLYLKEKAKFISVMKDELRGRIMNEFVRLRAKPYSYLIGGNIEDK